MEYREFIELPDNKKLDILEITRRKDIIEFALSSRIEVFRYTVSKNPNLSQDDLKRLSEDKSESVRANVARSLNLNLETLKKLSKDSSKLVKYAVISNLQTTVEMLKEILETEKDDEIKEQIPKNIKEREEEYKNIEKIYAIIQRLIKKINIWAYCHVRFTTK